MEVGEVANPPTEPVPRLSQCREVHVVLERQIRTELVAKSLEQSVAPPSGKVVGQGDLVAVGLEDARAADRRERDLRPADPGVRGESVCRLPDLGDERAGASDPSAKRAGRANGPGTLVLSVGAAAPGQAYAPAGWDSHYLEGDK